MKRESLIGHRFGRLVVLGNSDHKHRNGNAGFVNLVRCKCDCGNIVDVKPCSLYRGHTKSCGHCNTFIEDENFIRCIVKNGRSFIFDKEDLAKVRLHCWTVDPNGYVKSGNGKHGGQRLRVHRYILENCPKDCDVDHINGDPTDNRKCNLRISTHQNNSRNTKLRSDSTTGYKGVSFAKRERKYRAYITFKKQICLGYFDNPISAAYAYDRAAKYYFGEFAKTNFA